MVPVKQNRLYIQRNECKTNQKRAFRIIMLFVLFQQLSFFKPTYFSVGPNKGV